MVLRMCTKYLQVLGIYTHWCSPFQGYHKKLYIQRLLQEAAKIIVLTQTWLPESFA